MDVKHPGFLKRAFAERKAASARNAAALFDAARRDYDIAEIDAITAPPRGVAARVWKEYQVIVRVMIRV